MHTPETMGVAMEDDIRWQWGTFIWIFLVENNSIKRWRTGHFLHTLRTFLTFRQEGLCIGHFTSVYRTFFTEFSNDIREVI